MVISITKREPRSSTNEHAPCTRTTHRVTPCTQHSTSRYIGVSWHKAKATWSVWVTDPQTKKSRCFGYFTSEEDALRTHDCAALKLRGPGAKRNFPEETISEMPATVGEEQKQRGSSRYIVSWHKTSSSREGTCSCGTHRPSASEALGASPPSKTQPGRTTVQLCRRADQVPSATSRAR
jgi:hypothetical protein